MSRMKEIIEKCGEEYMLRQLAEECCELAHAALKLIRAKRKETPRRESEALEKFLEEIADVNVMLDAVCLDMLDENENKYIAIKEKFKENRMYERLLDGKMEQDVW